MAHLDEVEFGHSASTDSPRPRRIDRSRERYPMDGPLEEVYVEERMRHRNNNAPKLKLPSQQDGIVRRSFRSSRSIEPRRRRVGFNDRDQHISDDSDYDHKRSRAITRRKSDMRMVPKHRDDEDYWHRSAPKHRNDKSDSDSEYSSDEERRKEIKQRNRNMIYTGLACITSVAAANNIYQNTKNHHHRRNQIRDGDLSLEEEQKMKKKALMMDVFTLGVAAVGLNNVHNSWKKAESVRQEK